MGKSKEVGSRALIDGLSDFFTTSTPNRDCLVELIKNNIDKGQNSISLCFRGDYATMYYRCRQLLKIVYRNKQVKGLFNFRYALPNPDACKYRSDLAQLGVVFGNNECEVSIVLDGNGKVEHDNLKTILTKYIELIDFWMANKKSEVKESDRQQQLFAVGFGNSENMYFDIEYREPRDTLIKEGYYDHVVGGIEAKKAEYKKNCGGRFDLLGLRKADSGYILQFVEVKTKAGACDGKAGVLDHIRDYTKYCKYTNLVNKRKSDAVYTVNLLSKILGKANSLTIDDVIECEIVFIFTDDAVKKVERYRQHLRDNNIAICCYDRALNRIE